MKRIIAIALAMVLTGTATSYAVMTTVRPKEEVAPLPRHETIITPQPMKPATSEPIEAGIPSKPQEATDIAVPHISIEPETPMQEEQSPVAQAEITTAAQGVKAASTSGTKRPLPLPPPTETIVPPIPEPGTGADPEPVPEPDPPQPPATIIGNIYSCEEAAQAGHDYMTVYGWEYARDLSMVAGNCGYHPAVVLSTAYLQSCGGQSALNQAVMDTVDDTYARLYARNGEDAKWASVCCDVTYRETTDEYVINILYA